MRYLIILILLCSLVVASDYCDWSDNDCPEGQYCSGPKTGLKMTKCCPLDTQYDFFTDSCVGTCIDRDKDGFGQDCPAGEDCDDSDANKNKGNVGSCDAKTDTKDKPIEETPKKQPTRDKITDVEEDSCTQKCETVEENVESCVRQCPFQTTSQAQGDVEPHPGTKLLWMRTTQFEDASRRLHFRLQEKYFKKSNRSVITCVGCSPPGPPTFKELQKLELENEFDIIIEDDDVTGFFYEGRKIPDQTIVEIKENMHYRGFSKELVEDEIMKKYKAKTGKSYIWKKISYYWNRFWDYLG